MLAPFQVHLNYINLFLYTFSLANFYTGILEVERELQQFLCLDSPHPFYKSSQFILLPARGVRPSLDDSSKWVELCDRSYHVERLQIKYTT